MDAKLPVEQRPIKLIAKDNEVIYVDRKLIRHSGTLQTMLDMSIVNEDESFFGPVPVQVGSAVLKKIIKWCINHPEIESFESSYSPVNGRTTPLAYVIPSPVDIESCLMDSFSTYDKLFFKYMDHVTLYEVIIAASYLNIPMLIDLSTKYVASMISGKGTEEIRKHFSVEPDFDRPQEDTLAGKL